MIENQHKIELFDGAFVRLDTKRMRWPVFIADLCGTHYDIAGMTYSLDGEPIDPSSPKIAEIIRPQ